MPLDRLRDAVARARVRLLYRADRVRSQLFHPTTLGSRVILVSDGQVLLVRHSYRAGWFLPGGGLTRGESFEAAARREALGVKPWKKPAPPSGRCACTAST